MNDPLTIIHGDALSSLRQLPSESVHCCVTSPPFYGLRDYGVAAIVWDETVDCEHEFVQTRQYQDSPIRSGGEGVGFDDAPTTKAQRWRTHGACSLCGAWRGCLGLEPTPELFISHLVQIFREVRRVLRKDGTLWLNLGDSYSGSWGNYGGQNRGNGKQRSISTGSQVPNPAYDGLESFRPPTTNSTGCKPKDLIGIPWMAAFALRADGWWLRSDIIWAKKNCMPESVTDRPTRSHEYLFLLTKSAKYFYNADAIAEPAQVWAGQAGEWSRNGSVSDHIIPNQSAAQHRQGRTGKKAFRGQGAEREGENGPANRNGREMRDVGAGLTRNKRSVWTVATQPFSDAHFATFPPKLIEPCILAGASAGDVVLDPFAGSGTTGKVAIELGRKAILIEPKAEYVEMIEKRCRTTMGLALAI